MHKKIAAAALALLACAAAVFFWWTHFQNKIRFGEFKNSNIVLITIDTLRADHLPAYGYTGVKTPSLDRLAAESIVFEDAVAHVPMTLPSHASILTGLLPPSHGVRDNAGFVLSSQIQTAPEILKEHGYKTAAFVSAFVLDSQFKLDQGFDIYSDEFTLAEAHVSNTDLYRRAADTEKEVDAWLKNNSQEKFFLWVHYYDPHHPYEPPEPYDQQYAGRLYDGEIAYTDAIVGKFLDKLDELGLKQKTIVVLTGDHGEGLGEHNEQTHSLFIYNATQHVPLMFRLPEITSRRVKETVGHIDIVPTILDLVGIALPHSLQGKSLVPCFNGKAKASESEYSESLLAELHYGWSPLKSLTTGEYKFVEAPHPEFYDRRSDPGERNNLAMKNPEILVAFRKELNELMKSTPQPETTPVIDSETAEKLKALGYVATTAKSTAESRKVDPKDKIGILNAIAHAEDAMKNKNYALVIRTLTPVLQSEPQLIDAHYLTANAYLHLGNEELALKEFLKTVELKPDHTQTLYNLGFYYQIKNDLPAAEYWYSKLLQYEPENLFGNLNLAALYLSTKKPEKAQPLIMKVIDSYEKSIRTTADPTMKSALLEKVAEIYFRIGDLKRSEECINQAIQLTPNRAVMYFHLGNIYRRGNDINRSVQSFQKAIELDPKFYQAYYALAETYYVMNTNLEEAIRLIETANRAAPNKQADLFLQALRKKLTQRH